MTLLCLIVWWLIIIDDPTVTDCTVTDHHWWPYCSWLYGDWPSLMTLLWLWTIGSSMMVSHHTITVTVGSSMMDSHCAISHSRVINDSQTVIARWLTIIDDPTVADCMVTDHHWWPYYDFDCMVTDHHWFTLLWLIVRWLTIIDDPTGLSPCSHSRVINDG
jgi:hypothetical protein